jgi:hypothetical protein
MGAQVSSFLLQEDPSGVQPQELAYVVYDEDEMPYVELIDQLVPFNNLPRAMVEALWASFWDHANGYGINRDEWETIAMVLSDGIRHREQLTGAAFNDVCLNLFLAFALDGDDDVVDAMEIMLAITLISGMSRREKVEVVFDAFMPSDDDVLEGEVLTLGLKALLFGLAKANRAFSHSRLKSISRATSPDAVAAAAAPAAAAGQSRHSSSAQPQPQTQYPLDACLDHGKVIEALQRHFDGAISRQRFLEYVLLSGDDRVLQVPSFFFYYCYYYYLIPRSNTNERPRAVPVLQLLDVYHRAAAEARDSDVELEAVAPARSDRQHAEMDPEAAQDAGMGGGGFGNPDDFCAVGGGDEFMAVKVGR